MAESGRSCVCQCQRIDPYTAHYHPYEDRNEFKVSGLTENAIRLSILEHQRKLQGDRKQNGRFAMFARLAMLFLILSLAAIPVAEAQQCEESITGSVCESAGAVCSPPNGGTCRQVTNNAGNPAGCVCSGIKKTLFITTEAPRLEAKSTALLPYFIGGIGGLILGFVLMKVLSGKAQKEQG